MEYRMFWSNPAHGVGGGNGGYYLSHSRDPEPESFSAAQIDEGQFGAVFHPVTGERLSDLQYSKIERRFYTSQSTAQRRVRECGYESRLLRPRIGDGNPRFVHNLIHAHWIYDPFSGRRISG